MRRSEQRVSFTQTIAGFQWRSIAAWQPMAERMAEPLTQPVAQPSPHAADVILFWDSGQVSF